MNDGIMILMQQSAKVTNPEKRFPVSKNPPAASSGVNSFFLEKVIMDLRNGITYEEKMGYE